MEFLPPEIDAYAGAHCDDEDNLLKLINRETWAEVLMPRMLSGHVQGRILAMFSKMIRPKSILEIGTYTGYSALCLAEGLEPEGEMVTIDINDELENRVRGYFSKSAYHRNINYQIGNALEIIPGLKQTWDLVFIDADKINYHKYYEMCMPQLRRGGIIIADNVLWSGKVLLPEYKMDEDTLALHRFNQSVMEDPRVEKVLFPVRDGLMVCRKK